VATTTLSTVPPLADWPTRESEGASILDTGSRSPRGAMTIMFTDIEGSVALTRRLGDDRAHEVLRRHNAIIRAALAAHGGSEIKHTGDGFLATFSSASVAVRCAQAIQRALAAASDEIEGMRVRIGLHTGRPVVDGRDIFGLAVQLAARVCAEAEAGTILVSQAVRDLVGRTGLQLQARSATLRGFDEPVPVFAIVRRDTGRADMTAVRHSKVTTRQGEDDTKRINVTMASHSAFGAVAPVAVSAASGLIGGGQ